MRILLAQNSLYYPAHGGGDKSNRLLLEALAARGHECAAVARTSTFGDEEQQRLIGQLRERGIEPEPAAGGVVRFRRLGVDVDTVASANLRAHFAARAGEFRPDVIVTSTDDPAQLLFEAALRTPARIVYLARATLAVPFGPDCAFPSEAKTAALRRADAVVGVSEYVARYIRQWSGIPAVHVPISLMEPGEWPELGRFENEFVAMANPCVVKGISILLALADALPEVAFAAVPTWGANSRDREELARRPNIRLLAPVDDVNLLLARTRVLLVPSLWAEARSRMVVEALLRGVPVLAADVGGIPEAMMGVPYLLPVSPIVRYQARLDDQMVPVAEAPPQDIGPWRAALERLLSDRAHYAEIARRSRAAALAYASELNAGPFERVLEEALSRPARETRAAAAAAPPKQEALSPEKRRLLALRLRKRAGSAAWFPGAESAPGARLFCFPHAGGGAAAFAGWNPGPRATVCPVRLPGRESRLAEAPFERMAPLVEALAEAIAPYLDRPCAFFGHSMGAAAAFELARALRLAGKPGPRLLIASGARAPRFRLHHVPPPDPDDRQFIAELRRLEGMPAEVLDDRDVMQAILPALRADAALYRRWVYKEGPPLAIPIRAWGGTDDPNVRPEHLEAWGGHTSATFAWRTFPGGHFYLQTARDEVLRSLREELEAAW